MEEQLYVRMYRCMGAWMYVLGWGLDMIWDEMWVEEGREGMGFCYGIDCIGFIFV